MKDCLPIDFPVLDVRSGTQPLTIHPITVRSASVLFSFPVLLFREIVPSGRRTCAYQNGECLVLNNKYGLFNLFPFLGQTERYLYYSIVLVKCKVYSDKYTHIFLS